MAGERTSQQAFFGASALLFTASAALTTAWCGSMAATGEMAMPGGWTMSMAWMPMPGQTWLGAAATFLAMWLAMMAAMMLPSLAPTLWRYHQMMGGTSQRRLGRVTTLAGLGYFFVWTVFGIIVFPLGAMLAEIEMRQPALARFVPLGAGVVVVFAGAFQFSGWKVHHLACCREPFVHQQMSPANAAAAWRHGLRLGLDCAYGCAGYTAILLVMGIMDLRVMVLITAAITAERLAPNGERVARAIGMVVAGVGLLLIATAAAGLG